MIDVLRKGWSAGKWVPVAVGAVGAMVLGGCGGGGGSSTTTGTGTLAVTMSDAPPDPSVTAVNVTIDKVEANVNGAWTTITSTPKSFNLLDLVKNETLLGSASLPAGQYTQVRFFPSAASVTDKNGTQPLTIPSAAQTGIKVNVDYTIGPNVITTILLDFNVAKSLVKQGNGTYLLQPVIPAVVKVLSGTITGSATLNGLPVQGAAVSASYTAGAAYPLGTVVNTSMTLADGTYKVWALLPGTYSVTVTFTDPTTNQVKTAVVSGLVVTANQNTTAAAVALA